ncbi:hypothetical protein [uncultured Algibacter sp.]|uniref:hypothetical protein n=1 Tax=uncultured Algibacter sp. TaxID=298659 RepID=UPI002618F81C|nr:hypothetical protein [uncultured Algibacter sp.]
MQFLQDLLNNKEPDNWWKEYKDFCKDISKVDRSLFIEALPALLKKLENNYAHRDLRIALENESKSNASFGKEIYSKILEAQNPYLYDSLTDIISGLYKSDQKFAITKIKSLMSNAEISLSRIGIQSIAKIDLLDKATPKTFISWIEKQFNDIANTEALAESWPSIFFAVRIKRKVLKNADAIIDKLSSVKTIGIQLELIYFLDHNLNLEKEMKLFEKYLPLLLHIDLEHAGAYNHLAYRLENVAKTNLSIVVGFITDWIDMSLENARKIEYFSHLINTLCDDFYPDFQKLYTNWLNKDNPNFHIAIFEMNGARYMRNLLGLTLSEDVLKDLSDYDIEFITYKILAFVYDKDTSLSLVYSILEQKVDNKEVVPFLADLFIDHFIFNYYSTIEFLNLKKKTASRKLKKIIKDIIEEGENKYKAYSDLKVLKEFAPSEGRLMHYDKIQNKKFRKMYKETEDNSSPLRGLFKNLHYRAGASSFTKYNGEYTERMTPGVVSHKGEMPRGEFIDPIGQKKERLLWQNFKRRQ